MPSIFDDDYLNSKSTALQAWLLGYDLTNTVMVLTSDNIFFLASKKKIEFLRPLESNLDSSKTVPDIKLLVRDKEDMDKKNFSKLVDAIKSSNDGKTIGSFTKDKFPGDFMNAWRDALKKESFDQVDMAATFGYLMAAKEEVELSLVKKAAGLSSDIFSKYLKEQIMDIIDGDKKKPHSKISKDIEDQINNKESKLLSGSSVDKSAVDMCYPPIIQSGGNYKLKFSVASDKENLNFGAIVCSLGVRYKNYCSHIVRTLLVDPSQSLQDTYTYLVTLEELILDKLRAGTRLSDVYKAAMDNVKKEKPELADKMNKDFGAAMGIEFREGTLVIGPNCDAKVKKGMVFNVNIGVTGIQEKSSKDSKSKEVALFIGDTVEVTDGEAGVILTAYEKKVKNIAIFLKEDDSDDEKENLDNNMTSYAGDSGADAEYTTPLTTPKKPELSKRLMSGGLMSGGLTSTPQPGLRSLNTSSARLEARPSPERLDAQMRHLTGELSRTTSHLAKTVTQIGDTSELTKVVEASNKILGELKDNLVPLVKNIHDELREMRRDFTLRDDRYLDILRKIADSTAASASSSSATAGNTAATASNTAATPSSDDEKNQSLR